MGFCELWSVDQERDLSEFVRLVSFSGLVEEFQAGSGDRGMLMISVSDLQLENGSPAMSQCMFNANNWSVSWSMMGCE